MQQENRNAGSPLRGGPLSSRANVRYFLRGFSGRVNFRLVREAVGQPLRDFQGIQASLVCKELTEPAAAGTRPQPEFALVLFLLAQPLTGVDE